MLQQKKEMLQPPQRPKVQDLFPSEGGPSCDTIPIGEPKLLEGQHVVGALEVGEDSGVGDVVRGVGEALIDDAEEVEHELRLGDAMANVAEGVGGFLHLLGVVRDGGVALLDGVELVREEDCARLLVGAVEALNRQLTRGSGRFGRRPPWRD